MFAIDPAGHAVGQLLDLDAVVLVVDLAADAAVVFVVVGEADLVAVAVVIGAGSAVV